MLLALTGLLTRLTPTSEDDVGYILGTLPAAIVLAVEELLLSRLLQVQTVLVVGGKPVLFIPQTTMVQRQTVAMGTGHELKRRTHVSTRHHDL